MASNAIAFSASVFTSLLTTIGKTMMEYINTWLHSNIKSNDEKLLNYTNEACINKNTSPNSSSVVASRSCHMNLVENSASRLLHCSMLRICCLGTGMFTEPLHSNSWHCCSCLGQICHIMSYSGILEFKIDLCVVSTVSWYGRSCKWRLAQQLGVSQVLQGGEECWVQGESECLYFCVVKMIATH
jgi:hypothetical protein